MPQEFARGSSVKVLDCELAQIGVGYLGILESSNQVTSARWFIYVMPGGFPAHQPLPAPFADWARGLHYGLAALDWEIEWIAGGHGGVAPFTDLHSHFEN